MGFVSNALSEELATESILSGFHYLDVLVDGNSTLALVTAPTASTTQVFTDPDGSKFPIQAAWLMRIDNGSRKITYAPKIGDYAASHGVLSVSGNSIRATFNYKTRSGDYAMSEKMFSWSRVDLRSTAEQLLFENANCGWYPRFLTTEFQVEHFCYAGYYRVNGTSIMGQTQPSVMYQEYSDLLKSHSQGIVPKTTDAEVVQALLKSFPATECPKGFTQTELDKAVNDAKSVADTVGYNRGYQVGFAAIPKGFTQAELDKAVNDAKSAADTAGYDRGYKKGVAELDKAVNDAKSAADTAGYDRGYKKGVADTTVAKPPISNPVAPVITSVTSASLKEGQAIKGDPTTWFNLTINGSNFSNPAVFIPGIEQTIVNSSTNSIVLQVQQVYPSSTDPQKPVPQGDRYVTVKNKDASGNVVNETTKQGILTVADKVVSNSSSAVSKLNDRALGTNSSGVSFGYLSKYSNPNADLPLYHAGIDFSAKYVPVYSVTSGKIIAIDENKLGKVVVEADLNGQKVKVFYLHLSKIDVKVGDSVNPGITKLGTSGEMGAPGQPHLHIEVRTPSYPGTSAVGRISCPDKACDTMEEVDAITIDPVTLVDGVATSNVALEYGEFANQVTVQNIQTFLDRFGGDLKDKSLYGRFSLDANNFFLKVTDWNRPEIRSGVSKMSPAEIIYYASLENNINPVILLAKLQQEQSLITQTADQHRLNRATGYGIPNSNPTGDPTYASFLAQVTGLTFQFDKFRAMGKTIQEAYNTYTVSGNGQAGQVASFNTFKRFYDEYAGVMREIIGGITTAPVKNNPNLINPTDNSRSMNATVINFSWDFNNSANLVSDVKITLREAASYSGITGSYVGTCNAKSVGKVSSYSSSSCGTLKANQWYKWWVELNFTDGSKATGNGGYFMTAASTTIPPTPPTLTLTGLTSSCAATTLNSSGKTTCKAIATYSDNSTKDVTTSATWSSSNTAMLTVSQGNLIAGEATSNADVTVKAVYIEKNATKVSALVVKVLKVVDSVKPTGRLTSSIRTSYTKGEKIAVNWTASDNMQLAKVSFNVTSAGSTTVISSASKSVTTGWTNNGKNGAGSYEIDTSKLLGTYYYALWVKDATGLDQEAQTGSFTIIAPPPQVTGVSPLTATYGKLTTFTVTGSNLPDTLAFYLKDCPNPTVVGSRSATTQKFSCTPSYTKGTKDGKVNEKSGGTTLKSINVSVN